MFAPPVALTAYVVPAPTTNLSRKSGVPLEPLHKDHPVGIDAIEPDQRVITPAGTAYRIEALTNAVVANCVVLVPVDAVGAAGVPVNV